MKPDSCGKNDYIVLMRISIELLQFIQQILHIQRPGIHIQ